MEATIPHRKKIITLKEDTFRALSVMAAKQGTNLKRLIESMLDRAAAEYYPDGKVMLGKKEREEFIDWLGVVEK